MLIDSKTEISTKRLQARIRLGKFSTVPVSKYGYRDLVNKIRATIKIGTEVIEKFLSGLILLFKR